MKRTYLLYDARAIFDTDDATVLTVADSLKEARKDRDELFPEQGIVIYSYQDRDGQLVDEQFEEADPIKR